MLLRVWYVIAFDFNYDFFFFLVFKLIRIKSTNWLMMLHHNKKRAIVKTAENDYFSMGKKNHNLFKNHY